MAFSAIVAGTGFENSDGQSRAKIIRKHCKQGAEVFLKREPGNRHDKNAIAVYLDVTRLFRGTERVQIGYIKAGRAEKMAKKMDGGAAYKAYVSSMDAPSWKDYPRVSLRIEEK